MAAFFAAMLRAITPVGYMLHHDAETGRFAVVPCTGLVVQAHHQLSQPGADHGAHLGATHHDRRSHAPITNDAGQCPFAAFSLLFTPGAQAAALTIAADLSPFERWPVPFADNHSQRASSPPPSRAPPRSI